ncbi:hypothetical protein [Jannaschia sp. W003]|uniref:hypothetical protein n=1 Tax=Jannaschia sp. W003 TaxID=2867012 RepID=UPI0021A63FFC|nr:hypothetical protein [Jannaschia sp. W003]UWQ22243.1 hypothetical protein K3554_04205 [Jannaschia sp. W003]
MAIQPVPSPDAGSPLASVAPLGMPRTGRRPWCPVRLGLLGGGDLHDLLRTEMPVLALGPDDLAAALGGLVDAVLVETEVADPDGAWPGMLHDAPAGTVVAAAERAGVPAILLHRGGAEAARWHRALAERCAGVIVTDATAADAFADAVLAPEPACFARLHAPADPRAVADAPGVVFGAEPAALRPFALRPVPLTTPAAWDRDARRIEALLARSPAAVLAPGVDAALGMRVLLRAAACGCPLVAGEDADADLAAFRGEGAELRFALSRLLLDHDAAAEATARAARHAWQAHRAAHLAAAIAALAGRPAPVPAPVLAVEGGDRADPSAATHVVRLADGLQLDPDALLDLTVALDAHAPARVEGPEGEAALLDVRPVGTADGPVLRFDPRPGGGLVRRWTLADG